MYYTYAYLREDKTPYYIGKGKGKRIYNNRGRPCSTPKDKSRIIFLKQNLTEKEAFKHEIYMIAVFGRKDLGTGILRNLTNGGDGASGSIPWNTGKKLSKKHCEKLSAAGKGRKKSEEHKRKISGANNPRAKTWKITYENGRVEIVKGLQPWRIKNGYNKLGLRKLQLKEWKRYKDLVAVEEVAQGAL